MCVNTYNFLIILFYCYHYLLSCTYIIYICIYFILYYIYIIYMTLYYIYIMYILYIIYVCVFDSCGRAFGSVFSTLQTVEVAQENGDIPCSKEWSCSGHHKTKPLLAGKTSAVSRSQRVLCREERRVHLRMHLWSKTWGSCLIPAVVHLDLFSQPCRL